MKIEQTNVNIVYPRITDFRNKFVSSENTLQNHFQETTIYGMPENVPDEVPRAITSSKNNHSQLNVALTVTSLTTKFDNDFVNDWSKCQKYLSERSQSVYDLVDSLTDNHQEYVGLITNLSIDVAEEPMDILRKSILHNNGDDLGNPMSMSCRFVYVIDEHYYVNITLESGKIYQQLNKDGRNYLGKPLKNYIHATIDVNDKYAFLKKYDYISHRDEFNKILDINSQIINDNIEKLIFEGIFDYDSLSK